MIRKIEDVLDVYVRPQLLEHYGNIEVMKFENGILEVRFTGECRGCPSAKFTIEDIVEKKIKEHISTVKKVVLIEAVSDELLDFAKKILKKN